MKPSNRFACLLALGVAVGAAARDAVAQSEGDAVDPTATERALEELATAYARLTGLLGRSSDEAVDAVQGDIENLGDWEYRIVVFEDTTSEALETGLNALGNERWEAYWVESTENGMRFYLKRPSISYLSRVPLSTLLRMLSTGQ